MANVYVRSGAGGAGTGADWTNAFTTLAAAFTAKAAGDDFWVSEDHSEQTGATNTLSCPGTITAPCRVICVNHAGSVPPVSADLATTAVIGTTGAFGMTWTQSNTANYFYCYGIIWKTGSVANAASQTWPLNKATFENCSFQLNTTSATTAFLLGTGGASSDLTFQNCTWVFGASGQAINLRGGRMKFVSGSIAATGTLPTNVIAASSGTATTMNVIMDSVDLSALTSKTIVASMNTASNVQIVNCKMPTGFTTAAAPTGNQINDLIISDNGSGNTRHERYMYGGPLTTETTVIRSGGASDGTTGISWKIVANANNKRQIPIETFQIAVWNTSTGSSKVATIEILASAALTTADIWMEVEYLGNGSFPLATFVSSGIVDPLAAGVTLATSTATWGGSISTPTPQKLQITLTTPNLSLVGLVRATVKIAKASATLYVDPVLTVA